MTDEAPFTDNLNLAAAATREGLAELLRALHIYADRPSLRTLERWAQRNAKTALAPTTISEMLAGRRLPRKAVVLAFVEACGVPSDQLSPWRRAWERIAVSEDGRPTVAAELDQLRLQTREEAFQEAEARAAAIIADAEARAAEIIAEAKAAIGNDDPAEQDTSSAVAWSVLKRDLAGRLPTQLGDSLMLRDKTEHRRYVEVTWEEDSHHAETPNYHVLEGIEEPLLLTPADGQTLAQAGWQPPFRDAGQLNWWTTLPDNTGIETFVALIVAAFRDVQRVQNPSDLEYWSNPEREELISEIAEATQWNSEFT